MARRKQDRDVAPAKAMYVGAEGVLYDAADRPVAFMEPGAASGELAVRIVESVNALSRYTLDEIRSGAFRGGTNTNVGYGHGVATGNGNTVLA